MLLLPCCCATAVRQLGVVGRLLVRVCNASKGCSKPGCPNGPAECVWLCWSVCVCCLAQVGGPTTVQAWAPSSPLQQPAHPRQLRQLHPRPRLQAKGGSHLWRHCRSASSTCSPWLCCSLQTVVRAAVVLRVLLAGTLTVSILLPHCHCCRALQSPCFQRPRRPPPGLGCSRSSSPCCQRRLPAGRRQEEQEEGVSSPCAQMLP